MGTAVTHKCFQLHHNAHDTALQNNTYYITYVLQRIWEPCAQLHIHSSILIIFMFCTVNAGDGEVEMKGLIPMAPWQEEGSDW